MSKSSGNVLSPQELIGGDEVGLWLKNHSNLILNCFFYFYFSDLFFLNSCHSGVRKESSPHLELMFCGFGQPRWISRKMWRLGSINCQGSQTWSGRSDPLLGFCLGMSIVIKISRRHKMVCLARI
jgi:hypothetical protein